MRRLIRKWFAKPIKCEIPAYHNAIFADTKRRLEENSEYMALIRANPDVEIMFPELRDDPTC